MSGVDSNTERRQPNEKRRLGKARKGRLSTKTKLLVVIAIAALLTVLSLGGLYMWIVREPYVNRLRRARWRVARLFGVRPPACRVVCGTNLSGLQKCLQVYANDCDGQYPPADKWCDLLLQGDYVTEKNFVCIDARRKGDTGPSHYAINPNATPASDPNVVLVFETKAGWNQSGGPEILSTENHEGKGCFVVLVGGRVRFVTTEELARLRWK